MKYEISDDSITCRRDICGKQASQIFYDPRVVVETYNHSEVVNAIATADEISRTTDLIMCGFVAYEAASALNEKLSTKEPADEIPLVWFAGFKSWYLQPRQRIQSTDIAFNWTEDLDRESYMSSFNKIKDSLLHGNTYQVNLTVRSKSAFNGNPLELYENMIYAQKGNHSYFIETSKFSVLCASPELFFQTTDNLITLAPMKGTMARGKTLKDDAERYQLLKTSEKEISENLMIVDLIRNDVGQICKFGSVTGQDIFKIEQFPHLWQMTSTIKGTLLDHVDLVSIFKALFPCGSVTGVPKVSTMKIITELEKSPRAVYCGAVGTINYANKLRVYDFAVAIRTAVINKLTNLVTFGSGGGITIQSDSNSEWKELKLKLSPVRHDPLPDKLLETMRYEPQSGIKNLQRHIDRLCSSLTYFNIPFERVEIIDKLIAYCHTLDILSRVRLTVDTLGIIEITSSDFIDNESSSVALTLADEPIESNKLFLYHKYEDRSFYSTIKNSHPESDDVILFNENGHLTETTTANIAVKIDGIWITPKVTCGLLFGVEREVLLENNKIIEGTVLTSVLTESTELAVFNSLRGWTSAFLL